MVYIGTAVVILYCKPYQTYYFCRSHHAWFCWYSYRIYIEDNRTPVSLILQKDPERFIHNLNILELILCEIDLISTPFRDATIITY